MKKRTRAEYTKRIDKVFSNWKGYTHEAEYLERLANPSLEKLTNTRSLLLIVIRIILLWMSY